MKTMAFSNLIGSIIFLAIGIWAWFQTGNFPEVADRKSTRLNSSHP